jgi:hypothetical protein
MKQFSYPDQYKLNSTLQTVIEAWLKETRETINIPELNELASDMTIAALDAMSKQIQLDADAKARAEFYSEEEEFNDE